MINFQMPTSKEIVAAREELSAVINDAQRDHGFCERELAAWEGTGWHKSELLIGILVGLQIASRRNRIAERTIQFHPFVATPNNGPCSSCGKKRSNSIHKAPDGEW